MVSGFLDCHTLWHRVLFGFMEYVRPKDNESGGMPSGRRRPTCLRPQDPRVPIGGPSPCCFCDSSKAIVHKGQAGSQNGLCCCLAVQLVESLDCCSAHCSRSVRLFGSWIQGTLFVFEPLRPRAQGAALAFVDECVKHHAGQSLAMDPGRHMAALGTSPTSVCSRRASNPPSPWPLMTLDGSLLPFDWCLW